MEAGRVSSLILGFLEKAAKDRSPNQFSSLLGMPEVFERRNEAAHPWKMCRKLAVVVWQENANGGRDMLVFQGNHSQSLPMVLFVVFCVEELNTNVRLSTHKKVTQQT